MTPSRRTHVRSAGLAGLLAVLLVGVFAAVAATPARADVSAQQVARSLEQDPVYVADGIPAKYGSGLERDVRTALRQVEAPIYIAVLPASQLANDRELETLTNKFHEALGPGTYLTLAVGDALADSRFYAGSTAIPQRVERIADHAWDNSADDLGGFLTAFPQQVQAAVDGEGAAQQRSAAGGFPVALVVLLVLVAGGAFFYGVNRYRRHQRQEEQLERVRHVADEDVTRLGEDIAALDLDVTGEKLDDATRLDYQRALDSYDTAKRRLEKAKRPEDLRWVSQALEDGRYQMTCVRARLAGEEMPERRAPCFFDPRHGPSATDMDWAPSGGTTRSIPVCRADADRLRHGEEPEAREVLIGGHRRPYWEAGSSYAPWFGGYYGGFGMGGLLPGMLVGTMLGGAMGPGVDGFGGDFGGGGDFGDFGGGFGGGGDFGGGFGGGGFGGFGGGGGFDGGGGGF